MNLITDDMLLEFDQNRGRATYERLSSGSAIYPGQGTIQGLAYVALKLTGECAELDDTGDVYAATKEAGDVLWYLGAMNRELELTVHDQHDMDERARNIGPEWYAEHNSIPDGLKAAAMIGEQVGKAMRDDEGEISMDRLEKIHLLMTMIWIDVCDRLTSLGVSVSDCMLINLEKLRDRSMRGNLGGSGDDR